MSLPAPPTSHGLLTCLPRARIIARCKHIANTSHSPSCPIPLGVGASGGGTLSPTHSKGAAASRQNIGNASPGASKGALSHSRPRPVTCDANPAIATIVSCYPAPTGEDAHSSPICGKTPNTHGNADATLPPCPLSSMALNHCPRVSVCFVAIASYP